MAVTKIRSSAQLLIDADLAVGGNKVTGVTSPVLPQDAANKAYVDNNITTAFIARFATLIKLT